MKRRICVVTGSRADYGPLRPLLREIKREKSLTPSIIATRMHLSRKFGSTYKAIEEDGFFIDRKIELSMNSDDSVGISEATGSSISAKTCH